MRIRWAAAGGMIATAPAGRFGTVRGRDRRNLTKRELVAFQTGNAAQRSMIADAAQHSQGRTLKFRPGKSSKNHATFRRGNNQNALRGDQAKGGPNSRACHFFLVGTI